MNIITGKGVFGKYLEESCRKLIVILPGILLEGLEKTRRKLSGVLAEIRTRNLPHTSLDRQLYTNLLTWMSYQHNLLQFFLILSCIMSYHIISYHHIISCHVISFIIYRIVSYHIIYHIISYIILYYITLPLRKQASNRGGPSSFPESNIRGSGKGLSPNNYVYQCQLSLYQCYTGYLPVKQ